MSGLHPVAPSACRATGGVLALALLLALALAVPGTGARAQGIGGLAGGDGPLEINADEGIEWRRDSQQYIARGNARAAQGNMEVFADVLVADYRQDAEGQNQVYQIEAQGNVRIVSSGETVTGQLGRYDVDRKVMVLRGDNLKMVTGQDVITARDSFEFWEELQVAVARGNAVAIRGDRRVRADSLTAHLQKGADGKQAIERVDAIGNVEISTPTDSVRGDKGIYYVQRQFAKLFGGVKITRGENQMNGEYAEVDMQSGISKLMAAAPGTQAADRVRGLLIPRKRPGEPAQGEQ